MKKLLLLLALVSFTMSAQVTIFEDGFETYDDFAITSIGDWTQIDVDGDPTYGESNTYNWTNENYVGTAIIFNPLMTTPAFDAGTSPEWFPLAGEKGLFFFAESVAPFQNDDYFISPQIDLTGATGSSVTFWAKSLTDQYGLEPFEVLLSTGSNATVGDFTVNLTGGEVQAPIVYTEYTYDLSAYDGQQVYIAIHYLARDSWLFQVDDFLVEAVTVVGVDDLQALGFSYYPNPVANTLNMKANTAIDNVSVLNLLGQEVMNVTPNKLQTSIDFSNLNAGVYLVKAQIGNTSGTFKVIKE